MPQEVVIMIGPSGAGKSTLVQKMFKNSDRTTVVSSDVYKSSRSRIDAAVRKALKSGTNVVVDATHPTVERREQLARIAKEFGARTRCIHLDVPQMVARERSKLTGPPKYIVSATFQRNFERPGPECDVLNTYGNSSVANHSVQPKATQSPVTPKPPLNQNRAKKLKTSSGPPSWWNPMLAQKYNGHKVPPGSWFVSEKMDGIRAAWDGEDAFWTRGGIRVQAPNSFKRSLPKRPLNGELFAGRGKFDVASSMYLSPSEWRDLLQYRVFDAPTSETVYSRTYNALSAVLNKCDDNVSSHRACLIKQLRLQSDMNNVDIKELAQVIYERGGEGLILRANKPYRPGRSGNMLKVKKSSDAEAVVTGIVAGQGKYSGVMGSLEARFPSGATFKVGSGFSDTQRANAARLFPPGTKITVSFMELTKAGKPRHPVFKGVRTNV